MQGAIPAQDAAQQNRTVISYADYASSGCKVKAPDQAAPPPGAPMGMCLIRAGPGSAATCLALLHGERLSFLGLRRPLLSWPTPSPDQALASEQASLESLDMALAEDGLRKGQQQAPEQVHVRAQAGAAADRGAQQAGAQPAAAKRAARWKLLGCMTPPAELGEPAASAAAPRTKAPDVQPAAAGKRSGGGEEARGVIRVAAFLQVPSGLRVRTSRVSKQGSGSSNSSGSGASRWPTVLRCFS